MRLTIMDEFHFSFSVTAWKCRNRSSE